MVKLESLLASPDNFFVGMEYYRIMLNRTFLMFRDGNNLFGIKVNGLISEFHPTDNITNELLKNRIVLKDRDKVMSYVKKKYLERYEGVDLTDPAIIKIYKSNFIMDLVGARVTFNPKQKWGMGTYPHNGRINIQSKLGERRELILLGSQNEKKILEYLKF